MSPASVVIRELRVRYGERPALDGVSLDLCGGVTVVLGPNGAGKTTLLRRLATVAPIRHGDLWVDGLDPRVPADRERIRARLGYLPQDAAFAPGAKVFDVVDHLAVLKRQCPPRRRHAAVRRALVAVDLEERAGDRVRALSGGMHRRLGIAQALVGEPGLVVLDEPGPGLDPEQRLALRARLAELGRSATVVVSTHLTEEAAVFADRVLVLDEGRVVADGTPSALTAAAAGRVWWSDTPVGGPGVRACWATPGGRHRVVGEPPSGADLADPTLEDAYLLVVRPRAGR